MFLGTISIIALFFTKQFSNLPVYSLCLAIVADLIGLIPTIVFLKKKPEKDRPAMWMIFSLGYLFSIFAITDHTFANWVLPLFMVIAPAFVWVNLVKHRIKNKTPLRDWI